MIKEEIKLIKETQADLKKFGLTVGTVLFLIGALLLYLGKNSSAYFIAPGVVLLWAGFMYPEILKPLNKIWMTLAILLGWVMTRVILIVLFYLVITPIGFLAKIFRKEFLKLGYDKSAASYWEPRSKRTTDPAEYERQF